MYHGTHGTSLERAMSIQKSGFNPSQTGRVGRGVYFWAYQSNGRIARDLAIGWFNFQRRTGRIPAIEASKCGILDCHIGLPSQELLDCTTSEVKEVVAEYLRIADKFDDETISSAYESIIQHMQNKFNVAYSLIAANVPVPSKMSFKEHIIYGHPQVYVVRNKFEQIEVKSLEEIDATN